MNLLEENAIRSLIAAVQGDTDVLDPFHDEDPIDLTLDPVARITQPEPQEESVPTAIAPPVQDTLDMMTTSPKERRIAKKTFAQSTPGSSAAFQAAQAATGIPTTGQFVRRMLAKEGLPYQWGSTGQPDPESGKKAFDCSGIIYRIMQNFGFSNFPRVSGDIIAHAKPISVKKALKTRGAVLWTEGHIAVSLGNGKTIEARGEDYGVVIASGQGRFTKGGLLPELELGKAPQEARSSRKRKGNGQRVMFRSTDPLNKLDSMSSLVSAPAVFGKLADELEAPILRGRGKQDAPVSTKGVKGQLYAGFIEAGRPDLAKMVFTDAFDTWIDQESGWRSGVVSPANNQGRPNGGLFQFWEGHAWAQKYFKNGEFTANPYQQAIFAATHFNLTPDDIKRYAQEIRNGSYVGWG